MMIAGIVVILFIMGLFFEMLSSSPRREDEWQADTDSELNTTVVAAEPDQPVHA